jgi:glutamate racemase
MSTTVPIGIFDSGYGGLTVLSEIVNLLPEYDYCYLGDNARGPYGTRSFAAVYKYTREAVSWLFSKHCHLVILACNTASAKALRSIQQNDIVRIAPKRRVLGVIRPLTERAGILTKNGHIGLLATNGTVRSESYSIEINRFSPHVKLSQEACPLWVPIVENMELNNDGTQFFVKRHIDSLLKKDPEIDTVILGCTHYPLLEPLIRESLPAHIAIVNQGRIIAEQLMDYLRRHPDIDKKCTRKGKRIFFTTESPEVFDSPASRFYGSDLHAQHVEIS